jgi:hypothetical protein
MKALFLKLHYTIVEESAMEQEFDSGSEVEVNSKTSNKGKKSQAAVVVVAL